MMKIDRLAFPWQPYLGGGLFAVSLAVLVGVAPNLVAISCVLGGGAALALLAFARSRFALTVLTMLMLAISGCALLAALVIHSFALLPIAALQIAAILLVETPAGRIWMGEDLPGGSVDARLGGHRPLA